VFTGIIEEVGTVERLERRSTGGRLRVRCRAVLESLKEGSSLAVNGVCLTAVGPPSGAFVADISPETLRRSNLGELRPGALVNLERPLTPAGRLDGHIVQGHVDATGEVVEMRQAGESDWLLAVRFPSELSPYLVPKGSVALDGISLTIAEMEGDVLRVAVIPYTYRNTNLRARRRGDRVNIECDILAKYVLKKLEWLKAPSGSSFSAFLES